MKKIQLTALVLSVLVLQALTWALLQPFKLSVRAFSALSNRAVTASDKFRTAVAVFTFPLASLHGRLVDAGEMGVKSIVNEAYGE